MCIEQFWESLGENGIESCLKEWIIFGLVKRKWNTFMIERKERSKLEIVILSHSLENKQ